MEVYLLLCLGKGNRKEGMVIENGKRKAKSDLGTKKRDKKKKRRIEEEEEGEEVAFERKNDSEQLRFLESAMGTKFSSLELESLKENCILDVAKESDTDVNILAQNIKAAFGASWKQVLCEGQLIEGKVNAGCPAVLILSCSALRCIHLLRGFRSITKQCHAAKLFSKHMKLEEQISLLKNRVNIASGTPSRIQKLIDTEALGLSRLQVLVLDLHPDVKGYSLFTLPQVRDEFWDLFKNYFYQPMIQGDLRICLYGYQLAVRSLKGKQKQGGQTFNS